MASLRVEAHFANQFQGAMFHLDARVRLNQARWVVESGRAAGPSITILPIGTHVRFLKAVLRNGVLVYHFEVIDTHELFWCESEEDIFSGMDLNPIWDGDRNPNGLSQKPFSSP